MKNIIHWNQHKKMWTYHSYKGCNWSAVLLINGSWHTEVRPTKPTNPRGWVVTDSSFVEANPPSDVLKSYEKVGRLVYDKENRSFNETNGQMLLFDEEGCFLVKRTDVN